MSNPIFQQYVDLEAQIKFLTDQKEELRSKLLDVVSNETKGTDSKSVHTEFGRFTLVETAVWEYSDTLMTFEKEVNQKVKEMREEVSKKKVWAKGHGKAKQVDTKVTLTFSAKKGE